MSRFNNYGYAKPGYIWLSVKDQYGIEVLFTMKRSNKLNKLLNAYCDRQYVDINSTSFLFNGRSIRGEQTPHELYMKEGDTIHAILHQSEEHRVQYDQQVAINLSLEEEMIKLWNNSKANVVDTPQSSEDMSNHDASVDAIMYHSHTLTKGKAPIVDNGAFSLMSRQDKAPIVDNGAFSLMSGYKSILRTLTSRKEGGFAPPVGGTEDVGDADTAAPIIKNSKRKKTVSFQDGPSKRTRAFEKVGQTKDVSGFKLLEDDPEDGFEKDGDSHQQSGGHYAANSSFTPEPFDDDKLGVASVGVKDAAISSIYQHFAKVGSLLHYVMNKVQFLRGQSEAFQKKYSILHGRTNAREDDVRSLKDEVVGKVVKKPARVVEKPVEHIMDKMMEKEVIEKPLEGGPSSMEKVVLTDKSIEKDGEKVFQGGDTTIAPLSNVPIGGGGDGKGTTRSSLGGGVGDLINSINVFKDADASEGKDAPP